MKGIFLVVALLTALMGCARIDTGNVGVEKISGQVNMTEKAAGRYMDFLNRIDEFTAKELAMQMNDLKPKTRDNLFMQDMDLDVYFRTNPSKIAELTVKYQGDVSADANGDKIAAWNRVFRSARSAVYNVVSQYDALAMNQKRPEIEAQIAKALQEELNKNDPDTFTVTDLNIRALVTDNAIEASNRLNAQTQNEIDRKAKEVELAKQEANRIREVAKGEADANEILARSLTPQLIRLKEIEAQALFAKQGTHTVLMDGGATPLIQVK